MPYKYPKQPKRKLKSYDTPERIEKAIRSNLQKSIPGTHTAELLNHKNPDSDKTLLKEIMDALPTPPSGHDIRRITAEKLLTHLS